MIEKQDFVVLIGKTFTQLLRWETPPYIYKAITAITQGAPVIITSTGHSLVTGWRVLIESVKGMTQINSPTSWNKVTVIDANTIELNEINSLDFKPYISGGVLKYNTPVDLAGYTARMTVKDRIGGTVIISTEVAHAPLNVITATVNNTNKTISLAISAANTAVLTAKKCVYDLEMVSSGGVVTGLISGSITFVPEVTT